MNNFREKANQFFKENCEVDFDVRGDNLKEEILDFYNYYEMLAGSNDDEVINKAAEIITSEISSTDTNKIIDILMYSSMFEEEDWTDCTTNPYLIDVEEISKPISNREAELEDIDEEEYYDLFGGDNWDEGASRRSIEYCLQDIKSNKVLVSMCFDFVLQRCLVSILERSNFRNVSSDLEELLNIVL